MAVLGTVLSVAQTLLVALDNSALRQVYSIRGYRSHLDDLKNTVKSVKNVLLDAEAKEELSHEAQNYIEELKDAVYDADDLFDEFLTLTEQDKQHKDVKHLEKVLKFFSSRNPVKVAVTMSAHVKKIRKKLDEIANNHSKFGFVVDNKPIRKRRSETCSYIYAPDVIGREGDANAVVDVLLSPDYQNLTIVGVGGIGKTTLAQLVYNHQRIKNEFALRLWICISDQDGNAFDVKTILRKILELTTDQKIDGDSPLERVQNIFREEFEGKKYLLVLDDVWNENRNKWTELGQFLKTGADGSRFLVTTRSFQTARSMGHGYTYPLRGLSDEDSWSLFKITAFDIGPEQVYPNDFVEIGKKIIEKCANVPLAIKVIGSLLYGQDISKWQLFQQSKLGKIAESNTQIMPILKLSYYNLESSLKSCFSYCSVFPKDRVIDKEKLKLHWMALGYIVPFIEDQSIEDAAEEHFLILLRRCFFQEVKMENGEIVSIVIHDLMHDVAQHVAMNEICTTKNLGNKIRHQFSADWSCTESSFPKSKIRSCYEAIGVQSSLVDTLVANWICLRALTLNLLDSINLPDSIGNLLHLRLLDLSNNGKLEMLPDSITKLHNLQTLYLKNCRCLKELPKEFSKLVKLRHLHIKGCNLNCMPPDMDKLTNLCELTNFVAADESSSGVHQVGQLKDLRGLVNLRGSLKIKICENVRATALGNDWRGSNVEVAEFLTAVCIAFPNASNLDDEQRAKREQRIENDEVMIENLQLHPNLRELEVCHYSGAKIPMWGIRVDNLETFLPNLVEIKLEYCDQLQQLPPLSKLQYLKHLELCNLGTLEYMDIKNYSTTNDAAASGSGSSSSVAELSFFPSLESLALRNLSLKGWWCGMGLADQQPPFPRLSNLYIRECPQLTAFPPCPRLENLVLLGVDETLRIVTREDHSSLPLSVLMQSDTTSAGLKLAVWLHNDGHGCTMIRVENPLPSGMQHLTSLQNQEFFWSQESLPELISCLSALESSDISNRYDLKSFPDSMQNLTSLQRLDIRQIGGSRKFIFWGPI